jgi:signal transduction histidine kinase
MTAFGQADALVPPAPATTPTDAAATAAERADAQRLFTLHLDALHRRTDTIFAFLLVVQWLAMILVACTISPLVWSGAKSAVHPHVFAAVLVGGAIISLPLLLILLQPGKPATRQVVAIAQMLASALLIHLTGGRIETHFHVFGSLAFLAFYRDARVLLTASAVVAVDHWVRGVWWPQSVYGVLEPDALRWLEHVGWVVFEDVFLILFVRQSLAQLREVSLQRARQETDQRTLVAATREAQAARQVAQAHAEALARTNAELEQFAYVASHDLKQPLRMVVAYLELLGMRLGPRLDDDHRRFMGYATQGAKRMQQLLDDLLAYTRISNPQDSFTTVDLDAVVADARQALAIRIAEERAVIEVATLPRVVGSASLLGLLFQNLLANALKFRTSQPVRIGIACERAPDAWRISVSDNGIGIDPAHREQIFQVFQRLHPEEKYPGTGIGLAIARKITHQHGGIITVDAAPGGGSVFTVSLPVDRAASGGTSAAGTAGSRA